MRPNILFVFSDQHRYCAMGCAGNTEVSTPNIDAIAAEGAMFRNAYSNCPVCVPVRGTLLTGLHPLRHGAAGNDLPIRTDLRSVADELNDAGYDTAYIGKWHLGGVPRDQFITEDRRLGFRYWRANNCNHDYMNYFYDDNDNKRHYVRGYEPIVQTELALDYLRSRTKKDKPWAMYLCYSTPHNPYLRMPEEMQEHAKMRKVTLRDNVTRFSENDFEIPPEHHAYNTPRPNWNLGYPDEEALKLNIAGYYEHIEAMDAQIGRVLEHLKETGEYDNTIVIYLSDHGDMLGSHGMVDKQIYYEESAHIPFIVKWSGHVAPGPRSQLIGIEDISPTLLGMIGLKFAGDIDGHDLSRCLFDADANGHEYLYFHNIVPAHNAWFRSNGMWRAVTDGRYVYAADENGEPMALYDLINDPYQMNDIKSADKGNRLRLAGVLAEFVNRHDGFKPWQRLLVEHGLGDLWDESQLHFGFPAIDPKYK